MDHLNRLLEYFQAGGVLMYPLAACSLISVAVIIERAVRLRRGALIDARAVEDIQTLVEQGNYELAINRNRQSRVLVAQVLTQALEEYVYTSANIETSLVEAGERRLQVLQNNMSILTLIARISPLLGLLGTVLGMIFGFEALSEAGVGKEALADAIGVALITTATGLIIAIPTIVFITFFRSRIRRITAEFEEIFIDVIKSVKSAPAEADGNKVTETAPATAADNQS